MVEFANSGRQAEQAPSTLELARTIVAGKLRNSRTMLMRGARETKDADEAARLTRMTDKLSASLRATKAATSV